MDPVAAARRTVRALAPLTFSEPVACVYDPLEYAWRPHRRYLERFAALKAPCVLLGMNPGPYGMVQTGVPFGEVAAVRDWMGIEERVDRPDPEHPARPVLGFDCPRSEVSGRRLWGWAQERFGTPEAFFRRFYVHNYCPLAFMAGSGRNITPDKLPADERDPLFAVCDGLLRETIAALAPRRVIGIGAFAEQRARRVLAGLVPEIGRIPHPSPASPLANRGWAAAAERALMDQGIELPARASGA